MGGPVRAACWAVPTALALSVCACPLPCLGVLVCRSRSRSATRRCSAASRPRCRRCKKCLPRARTISSRSRCAQPSRARTVPPPSHAMPTNPVARTQHDALGSRVWALGDAAQCSLQAALTGRQAALLICSLLACKCAEWLACSLSCLPSILPSWWVAQGLQLALQCLSFDFVGTCMDDSSEELWTIQVPSSWRGVVEDATTSRLFLDYYGSTTPPLSSTALECLVRCCTARAVEQPAQRGRTLPLN